jgi:hypothetical protein
LQYQISVFPKHGWTASRSTGLKENEDRLMNIAAHGTASHVERLVRYYRGHQRSEALEQENRRHALRELSWYNDDDGAWAFQRERF